VEKELYSARLYYDLGSYFGNCTSGGNNYEACIVTSQNALKDYPYSNRREDFALLIMKSKYELALQSVESKKLERFQDAEDECYGFINEYPDSKERKRAEEYIAKCKKVTATAKD
jgi:outer membrane protein assembly factor BamD